MLQSLIYRMLLCTLILEYFSVKLKGITIMYMLHTNISFDNISSPTDKNIQPQTNIIDLVSKPRP